MTEITMPKLGESVTEGTIENWLVKVGDTVNEYDPLCEVNTAKVTAEVPSVYDGVITEILVEEGDTVDVGVPICKIEVAGEETPPDDQPDQKAETAAAETDETQTEKPAAAKQDGRRLSPVVMRLIGEHQIDINNLTGTGFNGRITKKDVEKYLENGPVKETAAAVKSAEK